MLFISGNSINVERWSGTLETLVGVPTPLTVIVLGKNVANVIQSLSSMIASYILVSLFLGYDLVINNPFLFAVSLVMTIVAFISFALIISPVFLMNPERAELPELDGVPGLHPLRISHFRSPCSLSGPRPSATSFRPIGPPAPST